MRGGIGNTDASSDEAGVTSAGTAEADDKDGKPTSKRKKWKKAKTSGHARDDQRATTPSGRLKAMKDTRDSLSHKIAMVMRTGKSGRSSGGQGGSGSAGGGGSGKTSSASDVEPSAVTISPNVEKPA